MSCDLRFAIWKFVRRVPRGLKLAVLALLLSTLNSQLSTVLAFEGRINAVTTRGSQSDALLYTVGTNFLRVEMTATNWPNPVDILDRNSGELTLLFPNNRSFVRLQSGGAYAPSRVPADASSAGVGREAHPTAPEAGALPMPTPQRIGPTNLPGMPAPPPMPMMPAGLPPGVGPQVQTPNAPGVHAMPQLPAMPNMPGGAGMPSMPAMPMMPMPGGAIELKSTGEKTNLLGFACEKFEIKQRGETMEIWATDQLFPFQPYVQNQPHHFGPRMIEEQWAELVKARKLFPLLAILKFDNGAERFRFEVQSVTPQKLTDDDAKLFQPPTNYFEIQPLPF